MVPFFAAAVLASTSLGAFDETTIIVLSEQCKPVAGATITVDQQKDKEGRLEPITEDLEQPPVTDADGVYRTRKIDPDSRVRVRANSADYGDGATEGIRKRTFIIQLRKPRYSRAYYSYPCQPMPVPSGCWPVYQYWPNGCSIERLYRSNAVVRSDEMMSPVEARYRAARKRLTELANGPTPSKPSVPARSHWRWKLGPEAVVRAQPTIRPDVLEHAADHLAIATK